MTSPESAAHREIPALAAAPIPRIPDAHTGEIGGLLEMLAEAGGKQDIPAARGPFPVGGDELLPILDAAALLGFAKVRGGDVTITTLGQQFAESDIEAGKAIFRQQVLANVPLVKRIVQTLRPREKGTMPSAYFLELLEAHYTEGRPNACSTPPSPGDATPNFTNTMIGME